MSEEMQLTLEHTLKTMRKLKEAKAEIKRLSEANTQVWSDNERLRAALDGVLRAVCGPDGFAAAIRQTSGMMYPWPALDAAEREARAVLAQEKPND